MLPNSHQCLFPTIQPLLLLVAPSFQGQDLCPLPFATALLLKVSTAESAAEGMSNWTVISARELLWAVGIVFFFSSCNNVCNVVSEDTSAHYLKRSTRLLLLETCTNKAARKSLGSFSLDNIVSFQLLALSPDWLQPLPKCHQLWRNLQDWMACTQSLTLC